MSESALGDHDAVPAIGARLLARHEAIAETMVERIVAEVATYRRGGRRLLDDVLILSTATAKILAGAFAAGRQVGREDMPVV
ncbi:MAG: hypothetical protein QOD24_559, partial [Solirubrobacteraceae bacterium]|nr:hypothetical protein [Solirubrobacteraceae bacterium]